MNISAINLNTIKNTISSVGEVSTDMCRSAKDTIKTKATDLYTNNKLVKDTVEIAKKNKNFIIGVGVIGIGAIQLAKCIKSIHNKISKK